MDGWLPQEAVRTVAEYSFPTTLKQTEIKQRQVPHKSLSSGQQIRASQQSLLPTAWRRSWGYGRRGCSPATCHPGRLEPLTPEPCWELQCGELASPVTVVYGPVKWLPFFFEQVEGKSLSSTFTEGLLHFILQKKERRAPEHNRDGPGVISVLTGSPAANQYTKCDKLRVVLSVRRGECDLEESLFFTTSLFYKDDMRIISIV